MCCVGSSDQAHLLINKGAVPALVRLLESSDNDEVRAGRINLYILRM
jgi:hypothetical protein